MTGNNTPAWFTEGYGGIKQKDILIRMAVTHQKSLFFSSLSLSTISASI